MTRASKASETWDAVIARRHPDAKSQDGEAVATAAAEAPPVAETEAEITARVHRELVERMRTILAAGDLAGKPDLALELVASGKNVGEALAALGNGHDTLAAARRAARLAR